MNASIISFALLLQQSPLDQPISYESEPARLDVVMADIGKQAGIEIKVQGAPLRDYVYVNVNKRPLRSTLDLFAKICEAKWREDAGQIIFSAPWPSVTDGGYGARLEMIQAWMKANPVPPILDDAQSFEILTELKDLESRPHSNAIYFAERKAFGRLPSGRAIIRLIHAIGAEELAEAPTNENVIYGLSQKGRIKALPSEARAIFEDFKRESRNLKDVMEAKGLHEQGPMFNELSALKQHNPEDLTDFYVTLISDGWGIVCEMPSFNGSNHHVSFHVGRRIEDPNQINTPEEVPEPYKTPFQQPKSWSEFGLTTDIPAWPSPMHPAFLERMKHLDEDEVLTDYADDVCRQIADDQGKDVIAILYDGGFRTFLSPSSRNRSLSRTLHYFQRGSMQSFEQDGALLFGPRFLASVRNSRVPRAEAAKFFRKQLNGDEVEIEDIIELAQTDGYGLETTLEIAGMVTSLTARSLSGSANSKAIRFYANLPQETRNRAQNGGYRATFRELTANQKEGIESIFYSVFMRKETHVVNSFSIYGLHDKAAFVSPEGIPDQAQVEILVETQPTVFYFMNAPNNPFYPVEANPPTLALNHAQAIARGENIAEKKCVAVANVGKLIIRVAPPGQPIFKGELKFSGVNRTTEFGTVKTLPDEFRKEYEAQLKAHLDRIKPGYSRLRVAFSP